MTTQDRVSLASLLLLAASPFGCSGKEPADEVAAMPPAVSAGPAAGAMPMAPADAAVLPASGPADANPYILGEIKAEGDRVVKRADADAREASGEIRGEAKEVSAEADQATDRVKDEARKMIEGARRNAAKRVKGAQAEVKKDAGDLKNEIAKDLLGDPK